MVHRKQKKTVGVICFPFKNVFRNYTYYVYSHNMNHSIGTTAKRIGQSHLHKPTERLRFLLLRKEKTGMEMQSSVPMANY